MQRIKSKIFPVLIFITVFMVVLLVQFAVSQQETNASISKLDDGQKNYFNLMLAKLPRTDLEDKPIVVGNKKIILINFWATWCSPCLEELPSLNKLQAEFQEKLIVIGINSDYEEPPSKIRKFISKKSISFQNIHDKDNAVADLFKVSTIPVTFIYVDGKVVEMIKGTKDFQSIEFKNQVQDWLKSN